MPECFYGTTTLDTLEDTMFVGTAMFLSIFDDGFKKRDSQTFFNGSYLLQVRILADSNTINYSMTPCMMDVLYEDLVCARRLDKHLLEGWGFQRSLTDLVEDG